MQVHLIADGRDTFDDILAETLRVQLHVLLKASGTFTRIYPHHCNDVNPCVTVNSDSFDLYASLAYVRAQHVKDIVELECWRITNDWDFRAEAIDTHRISFDLQHTGCKLSCSVVRWMKYLGHKNSTARLTRGSCARTTTSLGATPIASPRQ